MQGDVDARGTPIPAPVPVWKRALRTLGLTVGLVLLLGIGFVMFFEDKFIYFPTKGEVGPSPGEEVELTAADGVRIHGWYLPHPDAKVALLHFHGNAGNIEDRRELLTRIRGLKVNVLAIDYRGYGKSEGSPGEKGLNLDARAAYDGLAQRVQPDRIVVHGESLGAGPACELASTVPCGGLIVQSAFTSAPAMASRVMPLFPARLFMRTKYDNLSKVAKAACPKLFIHSRADEMIPFEMAEELYAKAAAPKECEWFAHADHNGITVMQGRKYYAALAKFLGSIAK